MNFYKQITALELECSCTQISIKKGERLMANKRRANVKKINALVKRLLPQLYYDLALQFYNPYNYYRTRKHIILVHSGIEYFLTFNQ